jgi:hypothetical protein
MITLDEIYTPLEEARDEIRQRWANQELRQKVEEFLGGVPPGVNSAPRAFLCRTIHTPNREFHRFIELASNTCLAPALNEYLDDRFCSLNPDKLGLIRMTFLRGHNRIGKPIFQRKMITDGNINLMPFTTIRTLWGENLIDFHHRILRNSFPSLVTENKSAWLHIHGVSAREFYPAHLARFICHGILFESFLETSDEFVFTKDVVLPALETVCSLFGMKPLIVRLIPEESENDPSWTWYEGEIHNLVTQELQTSQFFG